MKVLALSRYDRLGASSRLRMMQYIPWLEAQGISVTLEPLIPAEMIASKYRTGRYGLSALLRAYGGRVATMLGRKQFDLVWIEKEALPWWPLWVEKMLLSSLPYVLDYDDAVFHNYDLNRRDWVRALWGKRLDGLMAGAALVICGSSYLADRASQAGALWVERLPTVIDLARYPIRPKDTAKNEPIRIVWIGSPATEAYLHIVRQPLQQLAQRFDFVFRVIGARRFELPGVKVECLPWSEEAEVGMIAECDLGVMPLPDEPWERGKCGYKLIQYMACGLPVLASPVGANRQIVEHGVNGFLAESPAEWQAMLETLLADASSRQRMGRAGRDKAERQYCIQVTAPRLVEALRNAAVA